VVGASFSNHTGIAPHKAILEIEHAMPAAISSDCLHQPSKEP